MLEILLFIKNLANPDFLGQLAASFGPWMYLILFLIIFCETGLVVTPFLPGDSLLFAVGALCAVESSNLSLGVMMVTLLVAAILGDAVNYSIGYKVGPRVFAREKSRLFNPKHLLRTQEFYEKHGGKTIIIARFIPIVRTFAPFVAGIGKMAYSRFAMFNVSGAVAWIIGFLGLGYLVGNLAPVKRNFQFVIIGIIILSVLPAVYEFWRERKAQRALASRPTPKPVI